MPIYDVDALSIDISRHAVILDTNVLVRAFLKSEEAHEYARYFIEETDMQLLIPIAAVIEAWGLIVGSRSKWREGIEMLSWLNTPGKNVVIIPQQAELTNERAIILASSHIDCVDAMVALWAHNINHMCSLNPPLRVATYDATDFATMIGQHNLRFDILYLETDLP